MTAEVASAIIATLGATISLFAYLASRVQAAAARASAAYAEAQVHLARIDTHLPPLLDLLREYRSPEFTRSRHYILHELRTQYPPTLVGLSAIGQEKVLSVLSVLHYFDNVGLFVRARFVEPRYVSIFVGRAIEEVWESLLPYIEAERRRLGGTDLYAENFEYLVRHCNTSSQREGRNAL